MQIIVKYTNRTISNNKGFSMIEKLHELMGDQYREYIHFFSLRGHGTIDSIPQTEIIYIHAKTIVVDDQEVLIGSANINDRSLLGNRDSEMAVKIKDNNYVHSKMNGQDYSAAKFAITYRLRLLKEHLGCDLSDNTNPEWLIDPLSDEFYYNIRKISLSNTIIYREIFKCYPDNLYETFDDCEESYNVNDDLEYLKTKYALNKDMIIGHLVDFPINFLRKQKIKRSMFDKESLVPLINFI
jgi:phospholipase D1/2